MNITEFTYLLNKPKAITTDQVIALDAVLHEFPYLQSARALRLKGLYDQNSFKYNHELKITAAHTTDRAVLFDFITSNDFVTVQNEVFEQKVAETEISTSKIEALPKIDPLEQSILNSIKEATPTENSSTSENKVLENSGDLITNYIPTDLEKTTFSKRELDDILLEQESINIDFNFIPVTQADIDLENSPSQVAEVADEKPAKQCIAEVEEKLNIGTPLDFSSHEKHSFQEWLQLARHEPIDRSTAIDEKPIEVSDTPVVPPVLDDDKRKKAEIIDKFIEANPKISPVKSGATPLVVPFELNKEENTYLMTETLARVYLEQKKYTKAIQAYEILILKYPEKITFFADRIAEIKILQQNNNNN